MRTVGPFAVATAMVFPLLLLGASVQPTPPPPAFVQPATATEPATDVAQNPHTAAPQKATASTARSATPHRAAATTQPPVKPTTRPPAPKAANTTATITVSPVHAPFSQTAIDQCKLVLWRLNPSVIAGHNNCGWHWLDNVPVGTIVHVNSEVEPGRYRIVGHRWIPQKGTAVLPSWMSSYDLVLQTCTPTGSGFSLGVTI